MSPTTNSFQKRELGLALSLIMVIVSALCCSISSYASASGTEGIYTIKVFSTKLAEMMGRIGIGWIVIGLPLIWVLSISLTREQWSLRFVILAGVLTFTFVCIGIISNAGNSFRPVQSIYANGNSYNLSYYYNSSDNGFYDLIECRNLGLVCQQILTIRITYPEVDKAARLEIDENKRELAVIIEGKTVNSFPLD